MKKKTKLVDELIKGYNDKESLKFDPNGSWTGLTSNITEKPIQDADDL